MVKKDDCHKDGTQVLKVGSCTIHGGDDSTPGEWDLIVSLGANYRGTVDVTYGPGAKVLLPTFHKSMPHNGPILYIPWGDQDEGPFLMSHWGALLTDLSKIKGRVLFHCVGGHGRTGTALACLMHANGEKGDVVETLRAAYCKKAVESRWQIDYLKDLGIDTKAESRWGNYQTSSPWTKWWDTEDKDKGKTSTPTTSTGMGGKTPDPFRTENGEWRCSKEGWQFYPDAKTGLFPVVVRPNPATYPRICVYCQFNKPEQDFQGDGYSWEEYLSGATTEGVLKGCCNECAKHVKDQTR